MTENESNGMKNGMWRGLFERWFSPEGYLGIHLVAGFCIAALAAHFFTEITDEVFFELTSPIADSRAQAFVQAISSPGLTSVMRMITSTGDPIVMGLLSVIVFLVLLTRRSRRRLYAFGSIMIGGMLLNLLLKDIFHRNRPIGVAHLVKAGGYSFPSGHSMGSMLFYGALAYVLFFSTDRQWFARIAGVLVCVLAAFLIGASRVYLGVHYITDVAAGFTAALCWIGICISATEGWVRLRDRRRRRIAKNGGVGH
jgi:undecaprenyl-diphosphatase